MSREWPLHQDALLSLGSGCYCIAILRHHRQLFGGTERRKKESRIIWQIT